MRKKPDPGTDTVSDGTGFQPFVFSMSATQGVALGWYVAGPLALCIALWPWASPFGHGHRCSVKNSKRASRRLLLDLLAQFFAR